MRWSVGERLGYLWKHKGETLFGLGLAILAALIVLLIVPSTDTAVAAAVAGVMFLGLFAWYFERAGEKIEIQRLLTHRAYQWDYTITHSWQRFLHVGEATIEGDGLAFRPPYIDITIAVENYLPEAVTILEAENVRAVIDRHELPVPVLVQPVRIVSGLEETLRFRSRLEGSPFADRLQERIPINRWSFTAQLKMELFDAKEPATYQLGIQ